MKHVTKQGAPRDYIEWRQKVQGKENEHYNSLANPEKGELLKALVKEQGSLCAYTMRRIETESSHIEHIKPESLCRKDKRGSDLDYENMIACYPKGNMQAGYCYGAREKEDWWEDEGKYFVSPLDERCEAKFSFNLKGQITAFSNDRAALTTINVLKLDHPSLTDDRRRAIREFILGSSGDNPLSAKSAAQAIDLICKRNSKGKFNEFCVAIRFALIEHIKGLEKVAQRKKFIQSQQNNSNKRK